MAKETYIKVYKEEQDNVSSLQLDGVNDHVIISSLTNLSGSAITLECWFLGTNAQSIIRQQGGSDFISLVWSANRICILSNDGGTGAGLQFPSSIYNGEWQHLAMTWQQNTTNGYTIYVNGLVVAQRNSSNTPIIICQ